MRRLEAIPVIVIAPDGVEDFRSPGVKLPAAMAGWDDAGTLMRSDGVMLPLRTILPPRDPTEREWLKLLHDRVLANQGRTPTTIRA